MSAEFRLALRCQPREGATGAQILAGVGSAMTMPAADAPEAPVVRRLLEGPASESELDRVLRSAGAEGRARWLWWRRRAHERGLVGYRLYGGGEPIAELVPTQPTAPELGSRTDDGSLADSVERVQLSRFAHLRRVDGCLVLDSPLAVMRAELQPPAVAVVAACAGPAAVGDLAAGPLDPSGARMLVAALLDSGLLVPVDEEGNTAEEKDPVLSQWEFHDLLMHTRTRTVRGESPRGSTFRFASVRPAPPALRERAAGLWTGLDRPDLDGLVQSDVGLTRVMEERTSERRLLPPTISQLGELLYRTLRVRAVRPAPPVATGYETTSRPYPSAGGMYELTAYLVVGECDGLARGLYRYDPESHGLWNVSSERSHVDRLLRDAGRAAVLTADPPVTVVLVADFARLSWKYEGVAYSLALKNVGVVFASLQLVATAMGMGSCPLGGGDAELFARAIRANPLEEVSLGELIIGSRAGTAPATGPTRSPK